MRIEIHHETDRRGLLFKTTYYVVVLEVHFSHEEKHILEERRLTNTALLERRPATAKPNQRDDQFALSVKDILRGPDRFYTANPADAKAYQSQLLLALEQLKDLVELNAEGGARIVVEL